MCNFEMELNQEIRFKCILVENSVPMSTRNSERRYQGFQSLNVQNFLGNCTRGNSAQPLQTLVFSKFYIFDDKL